MNEPLDIKRGDRVRYHATSYFDRVGVVEEINDHIIYGENGEVCIRAPTLALDCRPREAVIEIVDDGREVSR